MLNLEFAELSDQGPSRDHNEDCVGHFLPGSESEAQTRGWLFAVADGVGGQDRGEVASATAVNSLISEFKSAAVSEMPNVLLQRLVQSANTRVYEEGSGRGSGLATIATTIVACIFRFDRVTVAHAGDSRCYLIRRGQTTPLTRDHTVANEQARLGILSNRQAARAPTSHILSRSLGTELFVNVDVSEHLLLAGDVLLLCSDGMHGSVEPLDMSEIVSRAPDLNDAAKRLVAIANERDGSDNVSIQLIRISSVERVGMYRGRLFKLR
jgi:serine/threonine protein phosphatase PrpC